MSPLANIVWANVSLKMYLCKCRMGKRHRTAIDNIPEFLNPFYVPLIQSSPLNLLNLCKQKVICVSSLLNDDIIDCHYHNGSQVEDMGVQHPLNHLGSFLLQNWRQISMFLVPVLLLPVALVSGTVCHYNLAF
jgi:hypothetical protein